MVGVITSNSLGLGRNTTNGLTIAGTTGEGANTANRSGDQIGINAVTGNLVISNTDEMLFGVGPDAALSRTYNSQGGGNGWQESVQRSVGGLTGAYGGAGTKVTRTDGDGSQTVFTWNASYTLNGLTGWYVANEGGGAYDVLKRSGSTWTWVSGSTGVSETYDASNSGRLLTSTDANGNALTYSYNASGQVSRVTTADGEYTNFVYSGSNLIELDTYAHADSTAAGDDTTGSAALVESTRVRYGYDSLGRLSTVTVDLTPTANPISNSSTYVTSYNYQDNTDLITNITGSDGTRTSIGYTQVGTTWKVIAIQQVMPGWTGNQYTQVYDPGGQVTTIYDPSGHAISVDYDANGDATEIDQSPPQKFVGLPDLLTQYTYDSMGNVLTQTLPGGQTTTYQYDAHGNLTFQQDQAGNTVTNTYSAANKLLTQTRYLTPASGSTAASSPETAYYVYDSNNNLRFAISAQGDVTEYRYGPTGLQTAEIQYPAAAYNTASLTVTSPPALSTLTTWAAAQNQTALERTDTFYDFRGSVSEEIEYSATTSTGAGDTTKPYSQTNYIYDHSGRLLSKQILGGAAQTYAYDGLGRVIASTDPNANTTTVYYNDGSSLVTVTQADYSTVTTLYNPYGELVSQSIGAAHVSAVGTPIQTGSGTVVSATNAATPTANVTALDGQYFLSQTSSGAAFDAVEYDFGTVRELSSVELDNISWQDGASGTASVNVLGSVDGVNWTALASIDLSGSGNQTLAATGVSGAYRYVKVSVASFTTNGQLKVDRLQVVGQTFGATTYAYDNQNDLRVVRDPTGQMQAFYFYDGEGRKSGLLLKDGTLTEYVYDANSNLTHTIRYQTKLTAAQIATLLATASDATNWVAYDRPAAQPGDLLSWNVYDNAGRVVETVDPTGAVTQLAYDGTGDLVSKTVYSNLLSLTTLAGFQSTAPTALVLPAANAAADQTTRYFYDADGRLVGTLDPSGYLTQTVYDAAGRKTDTYQYVTAAATGLRTSGTFAQLLTSVGAGAIHQQFTYDGRGLMTKSTDGLGNATTYAYNAAGQVTSVTDAASDQTQSVYDNDGNLVAVIDPRGKVARYAYDALGRQIYAVDAMGDVSYTQYDQNGNVTSKTVYATPINLTSLATVASANQISALVAAVDVSANDRVTTNTYDADSRLLTSTIDPTGLDLTTSYTYDQDGRLAAVKDAQGGITRYAYDAFGRQAYVIDAVGDIAYTQYDNDGRVIQTTAYATPISSTTLGTLSLVNSQAAIQALVTPSSANDRVTTNTYDAFGRLTSVVVDSGHLALTTTYGYDQDGNLVSKTLAGGGDPNVYTTRWVYDAFGREAFAIDADGGVTAFTYDADGHIVSQTAYGTPYAASGNPALAAMQSWATANANSNWTANSGAVVPADRTTRSVYDAAGRLTYVIDANGAVTQYGYDQDGNVTSTRRFATICALSGVQTLQAMNSWAASASLTGATTATGDETTTTNYDAAGRVSDTYDAATQLHTNYAYNSAGQVTTATVYGPAFNETTSNQYDAAGRLVSRTTASGTAAASTTRYGYDGVGRLTSSTSAWGTPAATTTQYGYDLAGRQNSKTVDVGGLNLSTSCQYDAFGDQVKETDADGNSSYSYYDGDGRLTLQVDGLGYAVRTGYDALGDATTVTRYYTATTGAAVGAPPTTVANTQHDAITTATYDLLGRLTSDTDAEHHVEYYQLDVFGDRTRVTNKIGGYTDYTYDGAGRVLTEKQTVAWTDSSGHPQTQIINNTYIYDAEGNITRKTLAAGAPEQQIISYAYDLDNRQISQTQQVYLNAATPSGTAIQSTKYDAFGNVVLTNDADGNQTYFYYDAANRKIAEIAVSNAVVTTDVNGNHTYSYVNPANRNQAESGPLGTLTNWTYDARGNLQSMVVFATTVSPTSAGGLPPTAPVDVAADQALATSQSPPPQAAAGAYRLTDYVYDNANRLISTTQKTVQYGFWTGVGPQYGFTDIVVSNKYDNNGNVIASRDGAGDWTNFYYDADNRKTAQVDQAGYITTYAYDDQGNILKEIQYATPTTPPGNDAVAVHVVGARPVPVSGSYNGVADRVTDFTYDRDGLKTSETREGVQATTVSSTGGLATTSQNSTILYTYDGLGDVLSETQATGDYTRYTYDSAGRQVHSEQTSYLDYGSGANNAPVMRTPSTDTAYNELGLVVQTIVRGDGTATAGDRKTTTAYGAGGRVISVTDPNNFVKTSSYDAEGNLVALQDVRQLSSGSETDTTAITYDSMNREISRQITGVNGATVTHGDSTDQYYDAYGEVVAEGINTGGVQANAQKYADYDNAGRVWRTNITDGVSRAYAYDYNGNATILFQSLGVTDLKSVANIAAVFTDSEATTSPFSWTVTIYDARNLAIHTIQPSSNQTSFSLQATEVNTIGQGMQSFNGNVVPATGSGTTAPGYNSGGAGAGSGPVGQTAWGYAGSGGSITIQPVISLQQLEGSPFGGSGYETQCSLNIDPSNAVLWGGGTCYLIGPGGVIPFVAGGAFNTDTQEFGVIANSNAALAYYAQEMAGQYTVVQDMPGGGQRTLAVINLGSQGSPATGAVVNQLVLQGIDSSATNVRCFVRPSGSSGPYVEVDASPLTTNYWYLNTDAAPFNTGNTNWEVRYMAFNGNGALVDSVDGQMSTAGAPSYSPSQDNVNGPGQSMLVNYGGRTYLALTGLPAGSSQLGVRYGSGYQNATLATEGAIWGQRGLYLVDVTGWGSQPFAVQTASGYSVGTLNAGSGPGDAQQSSWELTPQTQGNRTFTVMPPPGATSQQFRYKLPGGSWSAWMTPVNNTVDLSSLTGFFGSLTGVQYEYQTFSGAQSLSDTLGTLNLGYGVGQSAAVSSQQQPTNAEIQFSPQNFVTTTTADPAHTLDVYYRVADATGAYTGAFKSAQVTVDANGNFLWNIDDPSVALRPASGQNDVEYYYDAYDQAGHLLPPTNGDDHVHGYLTIQSTGYSVTNDYAIQWKSSLVNSTFTVDRQQTWNAFGEVASEIDGRTDDGHGVTYTMAQRTTSFTYNTLGKLITQTGPVVTSYDEHDVAVTAAPVETYFYDISGRQVGEEDANQHLTTTLLLADSGYDGKTAQTVTEFEGITQTGPGAYSAAATVTQNGFDIFGDERSITTAYGTPLAATTSNDYDNDGNLIEVDHALRTDGSQAGKRLIDKYTYDGLGELIRHTNNVYVNGSGNPTAAETTDYDTAGRVIQTTDFAGLTTTYGYAWFTTANASAGLFGSNGGWTKTTTNPAGLTTVEQDDVFGHEVWKKDFGLHTYNFTYNAAGQLKQQTSSAGQNITYDYYTNGYIEDVIDHTLQMESSYAYDNDGNRTKETYATIAASPVFYEDSTVTYDTLNRVIEISDPKADITYTYDAVGNRREMKSTYTDGLQGVAADGLTHTLLVQDYFYKYDSMNRFTVTMGTLVGGVGGTITAGQSGTFIQYDTAGNRQSAMYYNSTTGHYDTDVYTYTTDGYLLNTTTTDDTTNAVSTENRTDDLLGRVTSYITPTSTRAGIVYDGDNRITDETDTDSSGDVTQVHNDYRLLNGSAYTGADQGVITHSSSTTTLEGATVAMPAVNTVYSYQWWDEAKQSNIVTGSSATGAGDAEATGFSQITYDANGHIKQLVDAAGNRTINYVDDAYGQVMVREEWDQGVLGPRQLIYYFNGKQVGDISNNGKNPSQMDYAEELAQTPSSSAGKGGFRTGAPVTSADFDQNFQPINSQYPAMAAQSYTLTSADVASGGLPPLERLAQTLWGDANLWYLIADANGITLSTNLVAGQILTIPNKVANFHNTSATFKPYDPGEAIGDTLPTTAPVPQSLDLLTSVAQDWSDAGASAAASSQANSAVIQSLFGMGPGAGAAMASEVNWSSGAEANLPSHYGEPVDPYYWPAAFYGDLSSSLFMQMWSGIPEGVTYLEGLQSTEGSDSRLSSGYGPQPAPQQQQPQVQLPPVQLPNNPDDAAKAAANDPAAAQTLYHRAQLLGLSGGLVFTPEGTLARLPGATWGPSFTIAPPSFSAAMNSIQGLGGAAVDWTAAGQASDQVALSAGAGIGNQVPDNVSAQSYTNSPGDYGGGDGLTNDQIVNNIFGVDSGGGTTGGQIAVPGFDGSAAGYGLENLPDKLVGGTVGSQATNSAISTTAVSYNDGSGLGQTSSTSPLQGGLQLASFKLGNLTFVTEKDKGDDAHLELESLANGLGGAWFANTPIAPDGTRFYQDGLHLSVGRPDLGNANLQQLWELKPDGQQMKALNQVWNYSISTAPWFGFGQPVYKPAPAAPSFFQGNTLSLPGAFGTINYKYWASGVITWSYNLNPSYITVPQVLPIPEAAPGSLLRLAPEFVPAI